MGKVQIRKETNENVLLRPVNNDTAMLVVLEVGRPVTHSVYSLMLLCDQPDMPIVGLSEGSFSCFE